MRLKECLAVTAHDKSKNAYTMSDLLERAGFRIRGRRADCRRCEGGSRLTVSFNDEVAFCHRCAWKANIRMLARELGLLSNDPESQKRFAAEQQARAERDRIMQAFEYWRKLEYTNAAEQHRDLFRDAGIGRKLLVQDPEDQVAWRVLADYYHAEASLTRQMDYLSCSKASPWLERDSTLADVYGAWTSAHRKTA
jgi:hypothetical protein